MEWPLLLADAAALLGLAALTLTVSSLFRVEDPVVQVHATAKGAVLGVLLVLLASLFASDLAVVLECLLVGLFLLPTAAAASVALLHLHAHESGAAAPGGGDDGDPR